MDNIVSGFFCKSKAKIRDVQTSDKKVFHRVFHHPRRNRSHKSPEAEFKFLRMFYNIKYHFLTMKKPPLQIAKWVVLGDVFRNVISLGNVEVIPHFHLLR